VLSQLVPVRAITLALPQSAQSCLNGSEHTIEDQAQIQIGLVVITIKRLLKGSRCAQTFKTVLQHGVGAVDDKSMPKALGISVQTC